MREPVTPSLHLLPTVHMLKSPSLGQTWGTPAQQDRPRLHLGESQHTGGAATEEAKGSKKED